MAKRRKKKKSTLNQNDPNSFEAVMERMSEHPENVRFFTGDSVLIVIKRERDTCVVMPPTEIIVKDDDLHELIETLKRLDQSPYNDYGIVEIQNDNLV